MFTRVGMIQVVVMDTDYHVICEFTSSLKKNIVIINNVCTLE